MNKTVKCRFKHCKHDQKEIDREEAVCVNGLYYHKDCAHTREMINKIFDLFLDKVNPDQMPSVLRRVINNLVINQNVDPDYLFFALNKVIGNPGWHLKHAQGLYYVAKDPQFKFQYNMFKTHKTVYTFYVPDDEEEVTPKVKIQKQKSFEDIIGG